MVAEGGEFGGAPTCAKDLDKGKPGWEHPPPSPPLNLQRKAPPCVTHVHTLTHTHLHTHTRTRTLMHVTQVVCHMMPDLPNVGWERDLECFREFFENPDFRSDGLKLYPTLVIRGGCTHACVCVCVCVCVCRGRLMLFFFKTAGTEPCQPWRHQALSHPAAPAQQPPSSPASRASDQPCRAPPPPTCSRHRAVRAVKAWAKVQPPPLTSHAHPPPAAGTGLYELWKHGLYRNYHPDKLVDLVARILALLPPWVRVYRIQVRCGVGTTGGLVACVTNAWSFCLSTLGLVELVDGGARALRSWARVCRIQVRWAPSLFRPELVAGTAHALRSWVRVYPGALGTIDWLMACIDARCVGQSLWLEQRVPCSPGCA